MKLSSLRIQNFKMLKDLQVKELGRLNLIVGKNNSGKSTVLEALRIYAKNAHPILLNTITREHDENYQMNDKKNLDDETDVTPYYSFFPNRRYPDDEETAIMIGELNNPEGNLKLQRKLFLQKESNESDKGDGETIINTRIVPISMKKTGKLHEYVHDNIFEAIIVSKYEKSFLIPLRNEKFSKINRSLRLFDHKEIPCSRISTSFISSDSLADEWDKIALTQYEKYAIDALKIIEPRFENLAFIKNDEPEHDFASFLLGRRQTRDRVAKAKLSDSSSPVPLRSMGDGVWRVLQLALKALTAKEGFLLIDEFENSLHYSVQEHVWDWLLQLAKKLDIQVFATTHSWDCVESFAKIARKTDEPSCLFRLGRSVRKSDEGKIIATEFDKEALAQITKADLEVR